MKREEQKLIDTWDLESIYKNIEDLKEDISQIETMVNEFIEFKDIEYNSEVLKNSLDKYFSIWRKFEKVYVYVHHKFDSDMSNSEVQSLNNMVSQKLVEVDTNLSFYMPKLSSEIELLNEAVVMDEFGDYKKVLKDIIRGACYIQEEKVERILSLSGEVLSASSNIYSKFMNVDMKYPEVSDANGELHKLTSATYSTLLQSEDRVLRKNAFNNKYDSIGSFNETLSEIYISEIKKDIFIKEAKGYENLRQKALFGTQIPEVVYDNLIEEVNANMNLHHKYMNVRKREMKLDDLSMYDLYTPLVTGVDRDYTFEEAKEITLKALAPLGEDYISYINDAFDKRYIDIYPNDGKRSGAYSGGCYDTYPFILLNYTYKLNDIYTLVHELGHSMHTLLSNKRQLYQNASYKIFIAEIASTLNELLLTDYLLDNAQNEEERKYYLNYKLEQYKSTVFRQTMFAEFEHLSKKELEDNKTINAQRLNELYKELVDKYFAKEVNVDDKIKYEWTRIPHFYYNYYVYQYSTSFCASVDIYNKIKKDSSYINRYLEFLSLGGSVSSLDALKHLEIDFTTKQPIKAAMEDFERTLNDFQK